MSWISPSDTEIDGKPREREHPEYFFGGVGRKFEARNASRLPIDIEDFVCEEHNHEESEDPF